MTLLRPLDDPSTQSAPSAQPAPSAPTPRRRHGRTLSAFIAVIGLLLWAALTTPQVMTFTPQLASISSSATRWISDALTSGSGGAPVLAASSVNVPQACTSDSASAVGSNLVVPAGAWVCGDALAVGGNLDVQGHVQGHALALGGNVTISGEVDGDVTAVGGNITVQSGALTRGKLQSVGGRVTIEPGATAQAPAPTLDQRWYSGHGGPLAFRLASPETGAFWLGLLFWVSAAIGLSAFLPEAVGHVRYTIAHRFVVSGFSGALVALIGVVVGAALFITCIGIPVTLVIALALWIAWVVGTVAFGSWLGTSLLRGFRPRSDPSLLISTLLGVVILCLLKSAPVVGPVVSFVVGLVGLGAAALTLLSARRVSYARLRW